MQPRHAELSAHPCLHLGVLVALVAEIRTRGADLGLHLHEEHAVRAGQSAIRGLAPIEVQALRRGVGDSRERVAIADHRHAPVQHVHDLPGHLPTIRREQQVDRAVRELNLPSQVQVDEATDRRLAIGETHPLHLVVAPLLLQALAQLAALRGLPAPIKALEDEEEPATLGRLPRRSCIQGLAQLRDAGLDRSEIVLRERGPRGVRAAERVDESTHVGRLPDVRQGPDCGGQAGDVRLRELRGHGQQARARREDRAHTSRGEDVG
mmetsp:Transcript_109588/g.316853  ORF Transcript_109588/g.316853 Transcript_109588/m.316853 type:complete len:265 (+) Transcript_109588:305-1099(+)